MATQTVNIDLSTALAEPATELGPLLRLWGLMTSQLPEADATAADLAPFLIAILQEAVPFIDSAAPKDPPTAAAATPARRLWKPKGSKTHPDSAARVDLLERVVGAADLERVAARSSLSAVAAGRPAPETWACRRSLHRDAAARGTASWAEFRAALKDRHAESEDAFTPAVVGARRALAWDCAGVEASEGGRAWADFSLRLEEMRHRIAKPVLRDRTFPVLQMTCAAVPRPRPPPAHPATADAALSALPRSAAGPTPAMSVGAWDVGGNAAAGGEEEGAEAVKEFLVVSITVTDFARAPQAQLSKAKGTVLGSYVSVERVRKLPGWDGEIEWLMATASDARGVLPHWVQALAVPGQIAKDVPLFLAWTARERAGERHPSPPEPAAEAVGGTGAVAPPPAAAVAALVPPRPDAGVEAANGALQAPLVPTKVVAAPVPVEEAVVRSGSEAAEALVSTTTPADAAGGPARAADKPAAEHEEEPINAPEPVATVAAPSVAVQS